MTGGVDQPRDRVTGVAGEDLMPLAQRAVANRSRPTSACPIHGVPPTANRAFWLAKVAGNRRRDADTDAGGTRKGPGDPLISGAPLVLVPPY